MTRFICPFTHKLCYGVFDCKEKCEHKVAKPEKMEVTTNGALPHKR